MPSNQLVRHFVGIAAFVMIGAAVAMAYLLVVGRLLGRGGDGFGVTASAMAFPVLAGTSALLCWLPLWLLHQHRWGTMPPGRALLLGATIGAVIALVIGGPNGFLLRGGAPLFNYFLIGMLAAGAFVHNWILERHAG
jgi:hypothetical protein